jgi:hypothetical protein
VPIVDIPLVISIVGILCLLSVVGAPLLVSPPTTLVILLVGGDTNKGAGIIGKHTSKAFIYLIVILESMAGGFWASSVLLCALVCR